MENKAKPLSTKEEKNKTSCLYIHCNACKLRVREKCGKTGDALSKCAFPNRHVFKAMVPVPGTKKKLYKSFDTRNLSEAVTLLDEFKKELKENDFKKPAPVEKRKEEIEIEQEQKGNPVLLIECMALYVDYLNNKNVPEQFQKQRSEDYIQEIQRYLAYSIEALANADYDTNGIEVGKYSVQMVGKVHNHFLKVLELGPTTFNKGMGMLNTFFNYLIEIKGYKILNPFANIVYLKVKEKEVEVVEPEEFEKLIMSLTPENGVQTYTTRKDKKEIKKYLYQAYLQDGFKLGRKTGGRREELVSFEWSDIICDKQGRMVILKCENLKVNRIQNNQFEEQKSITRIHIDAELEAILYDMGYEKYKGTNLPILAPESTHNRETIMNNLTRAFTFYWKQLHTGKTATFKNLRKSYETDLIKTHGMNAHLVSGHSNMKTLIKHYMQKDAIAETLARGGLSRN